MVLGQSHNEKAANANRSRALPPTTDHYAKREHDANQT